MKFNMSFEGDTYEDQEELAIIYYAKEMHSCIWDARNKIRERLKYGEDVSDSEYRLLEELQEILWIEGLVC